MKKFMYLPLMIGTMACSSGSKTAPVAADLDLANLDSTVAPGADFYDFATGGWQKANPLKPEYARFGAFDQLRETSREQLRLLVEEVSKQKNQSGSVAQKIADLYNAGMDSVRLNQDGYLPLKKELDEIKAITDKNQLCSMIGKMHAQGIYPFFVPYIDADPKNSSMNLFQTYQGGLGLEERDYYLESDESMKKIRANYLKFIETIFTLSGTDAQEAARIAQDMVALETHLAKSAFTQVELRDPIRNYNKMSVDKLKDDFNAIDWNAYLKATSLDNAAMVSVGQIPFMKEVNHIIDTYPLSVLKEYLQFNLLNKAADYLSDDFVTANFDFYGKVLSGKQQQQPRWKRALNTTNSALGEAVGQLYVAKYFPAEAKDRMLKLVGNLQQALGERIQMVSWMSDETKKAALEKLHAFTVKIGYPDKWRDYSELQIDKNESYWNMVVASNNFEWNYQVSQNEKEVDKSKWFMSPQTVNAYYNPSSNEICFPAAILQPPFFYMNGDDAINYGAIGVVIGHEMTHGFDDQGRQFDKDGNINDWWTEEDTRKFNEKTAVLAEQFNQIKVLGDTHANGKFTLGENIADQGGILVAYRAMRSVLAAANAQDPMIDNMSQTQRFFLAYAGIWAGNIRDEEILRLTKIDPHSLGRWRVNGTLPNIDAFYQAFSIKEGDNMYRKPEDRIQIW